MRAESPIDRSKHASVRKLGLKRGANTFLTEDRSLAKLSPSCLRGRRTQASFVRNRGLCNR